MVNELDDKLYTQGTTTVAAVQRAKQKRKEYKSIEMHSLEEEIRLCTLRTI